MSKYTFTAVELASGLPLVELPLTGGKFTRQISSAGTWSATLQISDKQIQALSPVVNSQEDAVEIVVEKDDTIVYTGLVMSQSYNSTTQAVSLSGREIWAYWDRRLIEKTAVYAAKDQGLIVQDILNQAALSPQGDIRLDLPTTSQFLTGVLRDRTYLANDTKPVSGAIEELSKVIGGFEFTVEGYWVSNLLRHRLLFGYPMLGSRTEQGLQFELGSVESYTWARSGHINEVFAIGDDGSGGIKIRRSKAYPGRWPLYQRAVSFRDVSQVGTLDAHAQGEVARLSPGEVVFAAKVLGDQPPQFSTYSLGDDAIFKFSDPFFQGQGFVQRLTGWTLNPGPPEIVEFGSG